MFMALLLLRMTVKMVTDITKYFWDGGRTTAWGEIGRPLITSQEMDSR
jgi:cytochrome c peroxidase